MIEEEVERGGERDQERWARERGQKSAQLRNSRVIRGGKPLSWRSLR